MKKQMTGLSVCAALVAAVTLAAGCSTTTEPSPVTLDRTGFLSTYRHLEPSSPASLRYTDPNNRLARYTKFIVAPVEIRMYEDSDVTEEELDTIRLYLHGALADALSERYRVVSTPSFDTAEIRVAVTNIRKSTPILNVIPRPKLIDIGLGGLSMEGEIIDSVSNVQIAALIESRLGHSWTFDFTQLDDTKTVMDEWARHFTSLVDEAHQFAVARR